MWRIPEGGSGGTQKEPEFFLIGKSITNIHSSTLHVISNNLAPYTVIHDQQLLYSPRNGTSHTVSLPSSVLQYSALEVHAPHVV